MDIIERFLRYVSFETTSSEKVLSNKASTPKQYLLAAELEKEIKLLGGEDVDVDKFGTVYGYFPGTIKRDPIALIAHQDTSPSASGANIVPRIIENYDGKDIKLSDGIIMSVKEFPDLKISKGHEIIVTDGKTLLGGDDKAGIAIALDVVDYFVTKNIPHSPIEVIFSTDEEVGAGADHINLKKVKSKFGYTIDGGDIAYFSIENFNAASMFVTVKGRSIHPGSAKDKMINALNVAIDFHDSLPKFMRPEDTEGREGFYHLLSLHGNEEEATMQYIVRDHDINKLHFMLDYVRLAFERINNRYGSDVVSMKIVETYKNMKPEIEKHPEVIKKIEDIYNQMGIKYSYEAIRGGTDGAELTYRGFPCPNLGTGDYNCHGRFEYVDVNQMKTMSEIVKKLYK